MEKVYISTKEGVWYENVPAQISEEEEILMNSEDISLKEEKFKVLAEIKKRMTKIVEVEELPNILLHYDNVKQSLNLSKKDTYSLISISMLVTEDSASGILNCLVNKEHKQVRF